MSRVNEDPLKLLLIALIIFASYSCTNKRGYLLSQTNVIQTEANAVADSASMVPDANDTATRYIYLTFDDGPQQGTMNCYHICKSLGVKATFFMIGEHADTRHLKSWVDTISKSYPFTFLANHSYSHAYQNHYKKFYSTLPSHSALDFVRAQDSLRIPYRIVRFPGNSTWSLHDKVTGPKPTLKLGRYLDSSGYDIIGWDVEWAFKGKHSAPVQSAETMINLVNNYVNSDKLKTSKHLVLLSHDRMFNGAAADSLYKFIVVLRKNPHYVFETIDKYPGIKKNRS